jgi:curli production assembly/transport component CsgE
MLFALTSRFTYQNVGWREVAFVLASLLLGLPGQAQINRPLATPKTTPSSTGSEPAKPKQLSPQKMEEALRLLLRADSVASVHQRARLGPEASGLVLDQTITKIGHDFYDQFYSRWEAPADVSEYTVAVGEKPSRGNNAVIIVTVNGEDLLEFPLQGKSDIVEEAAQQAIGVAADFLQQAYELGKQLEKGNKQPLETY